MLFFHILFGVCAVLAQEDSSAQELIDGNIKITPELYKKIAPFFKDINFVFSPICFQFGSALLQSGAKGVTGEQIRQSLRLPSTKERVDKAISILFSALMGDNSYILDLAGKFFIPKNLPIKSNFTYRAYVENIDFSLSNISEIINAWVKNNTHNKIDDLETAGLLNGQTSGFFPKAEVIQANWTNQFSSKNSRNGAFYKNSGDIIRANYIYQHGHTYNYRECKDLDAHFVELPLGDGSVVLTIVLPRTKNGIVKLENKIEDVFKSYDYHKSTVHLQLPKFSIESSLDVNAILKSLGVTAVFNKCEVDLSGISGNKGDLVLTQMLFKYIISINEGGIEVPAATNVPTNPSTAPCEPVKWVIGDRPFIYYVKVKNLTVLVGRLSIPN